MAKHDFDAIVVGSGFGGSVLTYQLARAGMKVCLLERGKTYPPGTFPRSPWRMKSNFWDPSEGLHGMFNLWSFRGLGGVVSSGLGGGSLIYANVLYRKPPETFEPEGWPIGYADLEAHYEAAETMLNGQHYPFQQYLAPDPPAFAAYNRTSKTAAMQVAAQRLKAQGRQVEWELPKLAVTFANPGEEPALAEPIVGAPKSMFGRTRLTCQLCGECDLGCNYGSKNTCDLTFLSAALELSTPPDIRARAEVREFQPLDGGYLVKYVDHSAAIDGQKPDIPTGEMTLHELTAKYLVLSAGSFGSTFLLLKNQRHFPKIDKQALGSRFCGNGDLLTVLVRSNEDETRMARPRLLDSGYGPVITSAIRFREESDAGFRGYYYIEDAGYPEFANWLIESSNAWGLLKRSVRLARQFVPRWLRRNDDSDVGQEIAAFLGDCRLSSTSMPLLAMGRDTPDGRMTLTRSNRLSVDWTIQSSAPYFRNVRTSAREIARALHAGFWDNPLTYLSRVITVHPLGGCPMSERPEDGVVNTWGEVHQYPGLFVADGSVIPGPVGPNPSLTIAAVAGRVAEGIVGR